VTIHSRLSFLLRFAPFGTRFISVPPRCIYMHAFGCPSLLSLSLSLFSSRLPFPSLVRSGVCSSLSRACHSRRFCNFPLRSQPAKITMRLHACGSNKQAARPITHVETAQPCCSE
jgi:hypothetical protein